MKSEEKKFKKMQEAAEALNDAASQSAATVAILTEQMQESFECDSLQSAEEKLAELQKIYSDSESEYQHAMEKFKNEYGDLLEED